MAKKQFALKTSNLIATNKQALWCFNNLQSPASLSLSVLEMPMYTSSILLPNKAHRVFCLDPTKTKLWHSPSNAVLCPLHGTE